MKIFLDCEFYEYNPASWTTDWVVDEGEPERGRQPITYARDTPGANAIQLISLGAVREDGAEFYAENSEFGWSDIPEDHWLQENVRPHLWAGSRGHMFDGNPFRGSGGAPTTTGNWPPATIAQQFREFAGFRDATTRHLDPVLEFWGYMSDYDWVVLCGLYGRMVDLPPEFPMYCLDLKQEMHRMGVKREDLPVYQGAEHHALADARWLKRAYDYMPGDGMSAEEELEI